MKRAYKLQEFVAHTSDVNCLKIGRKSSRVLVTGGEDHKVNMWAIGKPNAILSLSGHSSAVESVTFDAAEALVVAGAASGTIKLWDLEEAKIVRTLTGHRSNCISVDFHPFGEFFASGSLDTNLKIWDIRRKGCIHTYKGHTRGIKCIKFSPDGRWVVSGSQDNTVKLWDLTAGKLMHDFKYHEGEVQCLDFHPQEFLLASGSVDKTVKFYDLETFELIGSSGPEVPGLRAMLFDPDGRSLLCAAHENLKVLSWEPLRYHDVVDVSWSKIADFNVHEEKLLGCSYNKNCVSVWVVDLVATPLQISSASRTNAVVMAKDTREQHPLKSTMPPILESPAKNVKMSSSKLKLDIHAVENFPTAPKTPRSCRVSAPANIVAQPYVLTPRKGSVTRVQSGDPNSHPVRAASDKTSLACNGARNNHIQVELDEVRKDNSLQLQDYSAEGLSQHVPEEHGTDKVDSSANVILKEAAQNRKGSTLGNHLPRKSTSCQVLPGHGELLKSTTPTANVERRSRSLNFDVPVVIYTSKEKCLEGADSNKSIMDMSSQCGDHDDTIAELLEQHINISGILQSRLTKLQIVRRFWERADFKGAIDTMKRLADNAVLCDVFSMILEGSEVLTLDTFAMVIPLLNILLSSTVDRHITTAISTLSILLKNFGSIIQSTLSTSPSIGVNLQAEQRHEKCNKCFTELQAVRGTLKPLSRRKNDIGRAASDLTMALDAVC